MADLSELVERQTQELQKLDSAFAERWPGGLAFLKENVLPALKGAASHLEAAGHVASAGDDAESVTGDPAVYLVLRPASTHRLPESRLECRLHQDKVRVQADLGYPAQWTLDQGYRACGEVDSVWAEGIVSEFVRQVFLQAIESRREPPEFFVV